MAVPEIDELDFSGLKEVLEITKQACIAAQEKSVRNASSLDEIDCSMLDESVARKIITAQLRSKNSPLIKNHDYEVWIYE